MFYPSPDAPTIYSTPPKIQNFSIPENIIFYISKNPSTAKVYNKLVKICKFFYFKKPIITLSKMDLSELSIWRYSGIIGGKAFKSIRMVERLDFKEKIWIYGDLQIVPKRNRVLTRLISKLFRCDITCLRISSGSGLTYKDLIFLTSSATLNQLVIESPVIENDENRSFVPIENLIKLCPNLNKFSDTNCVYGEYTAETVAKLLAIPHFHNLEEIKLEMIPEVFDFETFIKNKPFYANYDLNFDACYSKNFKTRFEIFADEMIAIGLTENRVASIDFIEANQNHAIGLAELRRASEKRFKKK